LCVALVYEQLFNAVRLSLLSLGPECCLCLGSSQPSWPSQLQPSRLLVSPFCVAHLFVFILSLLIAAPSFCSCSHLATWPPTSRPLCVITSVCCVNNSVSCLGRGRGPSLTHRLHAQLMPCIRTSSIVLSLCLSVCSSGLLSVCLWVRLSVAGKINYKN